MVSYFLRSSIPQDRYLYYLVEVFLPTSTLGTTYLEAIEFCTFMAILSYALALLRATQGDAKVREPEDVCRGILSAIQQSEDLAEHLRSTGRTK